jgi:hypothetical protein
MAKISGEQSIPSEWLDLYRATLNPHATGDIVKKRYPFELKHMQEGGKGVKAAQIAQRERFKTAKNLFLVLSQAERQRWYDNEPPYSSFLWYYNYFIMSALSGNANLEQGGAGVIKSIQVVKQSVPTTGGSSFSISTVDPAKTVVMLYGNSYISDKVQRGTVSVTNGGTGSDSLSPSIDPAISEVKLSGQVGRMDLDEGTGTGIWMPFYLSSLSSSSIVIGIQSVGLGGPFTCHYEIIEHKSQTIFPVITSIGANSIGIDWAKEPSVAADVSVLVIEYI